MKHKFRPALPAASQNHTSKPAKMTQGNLVLVNREDEIYECQRCERDFSSYNGLVNHCEKSAVHLWGAEWCSRCDRLFVSPSAREAHLKNSHRHYICEKCAKDYTTGEGLQKHQSQEHDDYCLRCNTFFDDVEQHEIDIHHKCVECGTFFDDRNELQQVWI